MVIVMGINHFLPLNKKTTNSAQALCNRVLDTGCVDGDKDTLDISNKAWQ